MESSGESPDLDPSTEADELRLLRAAYNGNLEDVTSLLSKGRAQVDAVNDTGKTALYLACSKGHYEIAELLLDHGASIDYASTNTSGFRAGHKSHTALHVATRKGKLEVIKLLLRRGADVHLLGDGSTPLHLASENGHCEAAAELLDHGSDVNATYKLRFRPPYDGGTALHLAAKAGSQEVVQLLINRNADVHVVDQSGQTALHASCYGGRNTKTSELIVKSGAEISVCDLGGYTALHYAAWVGLEETVKLLLNCKADANASFYGGVTPLHWACQGKSLHAAECLLKSGARVNLALSSSEGGQKGYTPLHYASDGDVFTVGLEYQIALIGLLFEWGADVNAEGDDGTTPLLLFFSWSSGHAREKAIAKVFAKHLMKMQAQNLFVSEANLQAFSNHSMSKNFSLACEGEIQRMREKMVGDSSITFFDVFTKGPLRLADYMANDSVAKVAESSDFESEFPIYSIEIRKKFDHGKERRDLESQSDSILSLSRFRYVPYLCRKTLNRYLTNEDLKNIIKAKTDQD